MASSTHATLTAAPGESIEVLRRVRAVETEWDEKLIAASRESEEALARLQEESATTLKEALVAAATERTRALERARADVEREVTTILAVGERTAQAAGRTEGKRPQDRRDQVLAAVLGPFAED